MERHIGDSIEDLGTHEEENVEDIAGENVEDIGGENVEDIAGESHEAEAVGEEDDWLEGAENPFHSENDKANGEAKYCSDDSSSIEDGEARDLGDRAPLPTLAQFMIPVTKQIMVPEDEPNQPLPIFKPPPNPSLRISGSESGSKCVDAEKVNHQLRTQLVAIHEVLELCQNKIHKEQEIIDFPDAPDYVEPSLTSNDVILDKDSSEDVSAKMSELLEKLQLKYDSQKSRSSELQRENRVFKMAAKATIQSFIESENSLNGKHIEPPIVPTFRIGAENFQI